MAQAPIDIDITGVDRRPFALLLDVARPLPADQIQMRWPLAGVTWVPWGCSNIDTDVVGCTVTNIKNLEDFPAIETQEAFLLLDGIACSALSSDPALMDARLRERLDVYASAAFAVELMHGINGGPNSFETNETTIISNVARPVGLAFADGERFLAEKLHGARGVFHITPGTLALAAAYGLVFFNNGGWQTATGHDVVADAGYTGGAPDGVAAPGADEVFLYVSGQIYYAITAISPVGQRNHESTDMTRNIHEFFAERYGLVAFDPCAVGAVRTDLTSLT